MSEMTKRIGSLLVVAALISICWFWIAKSADGDSATSARDLRDKAMTSESAVSAANRAPTSAAKPVDLLEEVSGNLVWRFPRAPHLPSVEYSTLSDTLEQWIQSLPAHKQALARQFAERYGPAYDSDHKAIQAWMLDMGFPSLEEVVAFDYDVHARDCSSQECRNPKVAALSADHFIQQLEKIVPPSLYANADMSDIAAVLPPKQLEEFSLAMGHATMYANRVRESGNVLFAAYLFERIERLTGNKNNADATLRFISACGDPRVSLGPMGDEGMGWALSALAHNNPCNFGPGRPLFPPGVGHANFDGGG